MMFDLFPQLQNETIGWIILGIINSMVAIVSVRWFRTNSKKMVKNVE